MRAFIAIDVPEAQKQRLASLRESIPGASWTRREGYHLTLRFLGDNVQESDVSKLAEALRAIEHATFEIALAGVGRFPPGERQAARVLWAGIESDTALQSLYRNVQAALVPLSFPLEERAFSPHLTIARLKTPTTQPEVARFLQKHANFRTDPFQATEYRLIQSMLTPQGAIYHTLASFALR